MIHSHLKDVFDTNGKLLSANQDLQLFSVNFSNYYDTLIMSKVVYYQTPYGNQIDEVDKPFVCISYIGTFDKLNIVSKRLRNELIKICEPYDIKTKDVKISVQEIMNGVSILVKTEATVEEVHLVYAEHNQKSSYNNEMYPISYKYNILI